MTIHDYPNVVVLSSERGGGHSKPARQNAKCGHGDYLVSRLPILCPLPTIAFFSLPHQKQLTATEDEDGPTELFANTLDDGFNDTVLPRHHTITE